MLPARTLDELDRFDRCVSPSLIVDVLFEACVVIAR
jgi:hypothetical protein